ncbi:MAG: acyl carrier protein [Bacteroidales bacterium]|nr:acyl carrier protein [Bacteroidales bacterium]
MNNDLKKDIIEILKKYAINKKIFENLPENPHITNDLKINSARLVDIVIDMEEKFNIEIENDNLKKLIYLNDIVTLIENKIKMI